MGIYDIHRPYFVFELLLLLKGKWGQNVTPVFMALLFFFNLMEEEFCTKFYGVLISFHEVIKLLKWHTRECMKYFTSPLFFYMFLLILLERTFWCFDHFWRTYRVKVTSSKQVNINNMLIVVSKQTFWKFSLMPFWWKALFLAKVVTLT